MTKRVVDFIFFVFTDRSKRKGKKSTLFRCRQIHCAYLETKMFHIAKLLSLSNIYLYLNILFAIPKHMFGKISKPQNVFNLANPIFLTDVFLLSTLFMLVGELNIFKIFYSNVQFS